MIAYTNYQFDARVQREAETLARYGFEVICLTPQNSESPSEFMSGGVLVKELTAAKYRGKGILAYTGSYMRFLWKAFKACSALFFSRRIDAIHVHNLPNFLVCAAVIPRIFGKKLVLDIHDSVPETYSSKFTDSSWLMFKLLCLEERLCCWVAHKIVCVNHVQREALISRGISRDKVFISMNVPDHELFGTDLRTNGGSSSAGFRIVYHGTMVKRLGVDLIIQAVALLVDKIPRLQLHLWGQGDDLDQFVQLTKDLHLQAIVHFKPQGVPLSELPERLISMDLGVVGNRTSRASQLMLPVKLLEYVALEVPVVAPRLKAIEYYFSNEMLAYYEPNDIDSMAAQIVGLYNDRQWRTAQAEKAKEFLQEYGWDKGQMELLGFYNSLLEERKQWKK